MLSQNFVYLALALVVVGNLAYIRDTLNGDTKPNRVTWLLWSVVPFIAFLAQKEGGGGQQALYTLTIAIMDIAIFGASFVNKKAYWKLTKFDTACGLVSITAAILLLSTVAASVVLVLSLLADFFAALPTLIKSFTNPETETLSTYLLEIVASGIIILTIHDWRFANYAFAIYILLINIVFGAILLRPRQTATT